MLFCFSVDVTTLSVPQLRTLQSRFNSELEQLTNSHTKLRAAQAKFRDCVRTINDGVIGKKPNSGGSADSTILVPLTSSLYVKGKLADREKVIVDVGTGFYVEKVRILSACKICPRPQYADDNFNPMARQPPKLSNFIIKKSRS